MCWYIYTLTYAIKCLDDFHDIIVWIVSVLSVNWYIVFVNFSWEGGAWTHNYTPTCMAQVLIEFWWTDLEWISILLLGLTVSISFSEFACMQELAYMWYVTFGWFLYENGYSKTCSNLSIFDIEWKTHTQTLTFVAFGTIRFWYTTYKVFVWFFENVLFIHDFCSILLLFTLFFPRWEHWKWELTNNKRRALCNLWSVEARETIQNRRTII